MDLSNAIGSRSGLTGTQHHSNIFISFLDCNVQFAAFFYLHSSVFMTFLYLYIPSVFVIGFNFILQKIKRLF